MKKQSIPAIQSDPPQREFFESVKQNLEVFKGDRGGKINKLPATASTADIIAKVNEIIDLLQSSA